MTSKSFTCLKLGMFLISLPYNWEIKGKHIHYGRESSSESKLWAKMSCRPVSLFDYCNSLSHQHLITLRALAVQDAKDLFYLHWLTIKLQRQYDISVSLAVQWVKFCLLTHAFEAVLIPLLHVMIRCNPNLCFVTIDWSEKLWEFLGLVVGFVSFVCVWLVWGGIFVVLFIHIYVCI